MKTPIKISLIFLLVFIFISALATFIPVEKYQSVYFKFIKDFRNKPQEHFDKQIEYANYIEQNGELPPELLETKHVNIKKQEPEKEQKKFPEKVKPKYIRDKDNPEILHPYKERKFLFFRFY